MELVSIIRSLFAWAMLAVILVAMFALLLGLRIVVRDPARRAAGARRVTERSAALYGRISPLYRMSFAGLEHLPDTPPYVVVANHESGLDTVCLMMLRVRARFLAASWLFRAPVIGWLMRQCGHIPVRKQEGEGEARALEDAEAALAAGTSVAIYPEGAYSLGDMQEFRLGAFVAAQRARVAIVPVRLTGTGAAWRPGTWIVEGQNDIGVRVLPAIGAEEVAELTPEGLATRVRAALADASGSDV